MEHGSDSSHTERLYRPVVPSLEVALENSEFMEDYVTVKAVRMTISSSPFLEMHNKTDF